MPQRSVVPSWLAGGIGPRIGQGPGLAIAPVKISLPLGPSSRQCPRLSRCRSPLPLSLRSVAAPLPNDARHRSESASTSDPIRRPMIDPKVATIETPSGTYVGNADSRPNRERCPEMSHEVGPAHFHAWAQRRFVFLGTAAFHDLSLPIPFERAILPPQLSTIRGECRPRRRDGSTMCITGGAWTSFDAHRD